MTDTTLPPDPAIERAQMDLDLARQNVLLEQIAQGITRLRKRLTEAGFVIHKHYELRHPSSGIVFGSQYAGGEYQVTLAGLPAANPPEVTLRLTKDRIATDDGLVDVLTEVILHINAGADYRVHIGAGNVVYGIECDTGDPEGRGILWGERYTEDSHGEAWGDWSEFDEDEDLLSGEPLDREPPDMSGPGNPSGDGR